MTSTRGGTRRRRPVLVPVSALVVATGVIVAAASGGFERIPDDPPPMLRAGQEIDQELFRTTVVDAVVHRIRADPGSAGGVERTVLDLRLKVFNEVANSAPVLAVQKSLLKIAPPDGGPLVSREPDPAASPAPSPSASGPVWNYDMFIPASGADGRWLPPRITSTVVMRFRVPDGVTPPERITIDFGGYELYEDWFTGRHRPELIVDDNLDEVVTARVTLPVRQEGR